MENIKGYTEQEIQATEDYGVSFAQFIEREWGLSSRNGLHSQEKRRIEEIENHMEGNVDVSDFSDILNINQDISTIALDWTHISILPKYINVVSESFSNDLYKVTAKGIDNLSLRNKANYKKSKLKDLYAKPAMEAMFKATTVDMRSKDEFESEEEIEAHVDFEYKPPKDAAIEIAVQKMYDLNRFKETKKAIDRDLVSHGIAAARHYYDNEMGIKIRRVNPKYFVYSESPSTSPDMDDAFYYGEVLFKTISQICKETNKFGKEEKEAIARAYTNRYGNTNKVTESNVDDFIIPVLDFAFKTVKTDVYKKKKNAYGQTSIKKKEAGWNPKYKKDYERVTDSYEVWYEGFYILDSDKIYNYRLMENMARPYSDINRTFPPFVMYKMPYLSIGERILPHAKQIFITYMKMQQIVAQMKPKGIAIDIDAMQDLDIGTGKLLNPAEQIRIYEEKGTVLYSGSALDGSLNRMPIHDIPQSTRNEITELVAAYNHHLSQIEDVTGVNKFKDGSTPDGDALLGVQKLAIAMSNNATKGFFDGTMSLVKRLSEACVARIQDMSADKKVYRGLIAAIGAENHEAIKQYGDAHMYQFSTTIEMKPTEEEKQQLREDLAVALKAGQITVTDKVDIEQVDNIKYGNWLLKVKMKKRAKEIQKQQQQAFQMQQQAEQRKQQMELQGEIQKEQALAQIKMKQDRQNYMYDKDKLVTEYTLKAKIERMSLQRDFALKDREKENREDLQKKNNKAEDERLEKQSTHQSSLIQQRDGLKGEQNFMDNL